jgi:hypothetical protein
MWIEFNIYLIQTDCEMHASTSCNDTKNDCLLRPMEFKIWCTETY